jgi:hypothetical protein
MVVAQLSPVANKFCRVGQMLSRSAQDHQPMNAKSDSTPNTPYEPLLVLSAAIESEVETRFRFWQAQPE